MSSMLSSMFSPLWALCCPTDQSSPTGQSFDVKVPPVDVRVPPVSSDLLRVAVWNAAGFDVTVQQQYQAAIQKSKARPQNCRNAYSAAKHFWDDKVDVVIIPECDDYSGKFSDRNYDHSTETAFKNQGFEKVTAKRKDYAIVDKNTCIFYRAATLDPVGDEWGNKECMRAGPGSHPGKVVGKAFIMKKTDDWILITAVHAGHYGRDDELVSDYQNQKETKNVKQAKQDVKGLRNFQTDFLQSWDSHGRRNREWSKVIVAGDFNELGNLISADPKQFCPLPEGFEYKGTNNIGFTVGGHGKYDHIWWATSHRTMPVKSGKNPSIRMGQKFGSDHSCVVAENI